MANFMSSVIMNSMKRVLYAKSVNKAMNRELYERKKVTERELMWQGLKGVIKVRRLQAVLPGRSIQ